MKTRRRPNSSPASEAAATLARLRARSLSPQRRQAIAKKAAEARKRALSPARRRSIAKKAARARWATGRRRK